jgi:hypothetical protein
MIRAWMDLEAGIDTVSLAVPGRLPLGLGTCQPGRLVWILRLGSLKVLSGSIS